MFSSIKSIFRRPPPPPARASLLGLPLELRLKIYAYAIPISAIVEPQDGAKSIISVRGEPIPPSEEFILLPPLAQTCRQLREDAAKYYLGRNTFMVYFNRYYPDGGRWLWKIEPLWYALSNVVLQLDSEATRARKEKGQMLEVTVKVEGDGSAIGARANVKLGEKERYGITHAMRKTLMWDRRQEEVLDGRALVACVKWLMGNVFKNEMIPGKDYETMKWTADEVFSAM